MFDKIDHYKRQNNFVNEQLKHTHTHHRHTGKHTHAHTRCHINVYVKYAKQLESRQQDRTENVDGEVGNTQSVGGDDSDDSALALSFGRNANVSSS